MGTISSGVGLVSGININDIVTALMNVEKKPVDLLTQRVQGLKTHQTGLAQLSANLLTFNTSGSVLKDTKSFDKRTVANSDTSQLNVTAKSGAPLGDYTLQALRRAATQQVVSKGFADSTTQTVGTGTITISKGGGLNSRTKLDMLNGGTGVQRGTFRITDRSGNSADIDLSSAVTVDDVLKAINTNSQIAVTATARGNGIVLTDETGQTASNLIVTDLSGQHVAADLGLVKSVASNTLTGNNVFQITGDFKLSQINDGNAVRLTHTSAADLRISLTDNPTSTVDVDLDGAVTLNDVVNRINSASGNGGKVSAAVNNGRLVLTDLTAGGGPGALTVTNLNGASVVNELGLNATAAGNVLTGKSLSAGIDSVLLRNLRGGQGITQLGSVTLTDRTGTSATLDLSGAETLDDVVAAINQATSAGSVKLQLTAAIDASGKGIQITDTSGASASNLIIADNAGSTLATELGIAVNAAQTSVASGSLSLQHVNAATTLAAYSKNGTVDQNSFTITDSAGGQSIVNVGSGTTDLGGLIQQINSLTGVQVTAQLNDTGDGIVLIDQAGGAGQLQVQELGGTTAADLRLLGTGTTGLDGKSRIVGRTSTTIAVTATDTLSSIATKINNAGGGVFATTLDDGSSVNSTRFVLQANASGTAGAFLVDDGGLGLGLATYTEAQDAALRVGSSAQTGFVLTSTTNHFDNVAGALSVDIKSINNQTADVQLTQDTSGISKAIQNFVNSYNSLQSVTATLTAFNTSGASLSDPSAAVKNGPLQGDSIVLQVLARFNSVLNQQIGSKTSSVRSLFDLGVSVGGDGNLAFDTTKFQAAMNNNPQDVKSFFTTAKTGFGAALANAVTAYTDPITGTITRESDADQSSIDSMNDRIDELNAILAKRQQTLTLQFYNMEQTLAQLNSQQTALSSLSGAVATAKSSGSGSSSK
jgi:flagellar hook-associated protein 2